MDEFVCVNCQKRRIKRGEIFRILKPFLLIFFVLPLGGSVCDECAQLFDAIGFILAAASVSLTVTLVLVLLT